MAALKHGGNINEAAALFGRPASAWLDLSTGINPSPWQFDGCIPAYCLEQLPYPSPALYSTAARYYGCRRLLATPGSQSVIQALPSILPEARRVMIPWPGYEEHGWHWQHKGCQIEYYPADAEDLPERVKRSRPDVVVVINPNNPDGKCFHRDELQSILALQAQHDGFLVVDEAFIDTRPQDSLIDLDSTQLLVLRSLGKFFGLPGLRVGFVSCSEMLKAKLETVIGPWAISGASQYIATKSLADTDWHKSSLRLLQLRSALQLAFLQDAFAGLDEFDFKATDFFISSYCSQKTAKALYEYYASQGILIRVFDFSGVEGDIGTRREAMVRFGLCPGGVESGNQREMSNDQPMYKRENAQVEKWQHFKSATDYWVKRQASDRFQYEKK
ncbi:MAG: pyridoxal phosphate-dependent class II aminotransferase [Pseudomonadales bacterium]|nr:pyridoxal phosphate-dependent class II aminotransferase [Pseudomonadales bacterium]